ncbi:expressed unknown protein [Seminavis robusta]|uniref:Uncharacterized protein n=1 Tax=Seminavis robusta TaxID=568900 RepID=A0A9N8HDB8_9STRA|nr:expressed unknown protein [Seminavis robusta]|eukprot:Sro336_g120410.1 n/a (318) ;mRNA; f:61346-62299
MANNNSDSRKSIDDEKERKRQEASMLETFLRVSKARVEEIRIQQARDLNLSDGELLVLNNIHGAGMMEGLIAGVTTFVIARRLPRYLQQRAAARRRQQSGYTLDALPGGSPFHKDVNNKRPFIWRAFQFTLDVTLSVLVAANTSAYMADTQKLAKQVTDIPLMEGRSAISDHFCEVLVQEYKRQWNASQQEQLNDTNSGDFSTTGQSKGYEKDVPLDPNFDRKSILKDPKLPFLKGYIEFIQNCQKRQAIERRIRQERGMAPSEPVEIPAPGVPSDTSEDSSLFVDGGGADFSDDDGWTEEDVSSFATDQDEDDRRK